MTRAKSSHDGHDPQRTKNVGPRKFWCSWVKFEWIWQDLACITLFGMKIPNGKTKSKLDTESYSCISIGDSCTNSLVQDKSFPFPTVLYHKGVATSPGSDLADSSFINGGNEENVTEKEMSCLIKSFFHVLGVREKMRQVWVHNRSQHTDDGWTPYSYPRVIERGERTTVSLIDSYLIH